MDRLSKKPSSEQNIYLSWCGPQPYWQSSARVSYRVTRWAMEGRGAPKGEREQLGGLGGLDRWPGGVQVSTSWERHHYPPTVAMFMYDVKLRTVDAGIAHV